MVSPISPPDGNAGGITLPSLLSYVPPSPVSSIAARGPFPPLASSVEGVVTEINPDMWRGNLISPTPSWMAPLVARFETFNTSKSDSLVGVGQQGYCSPITTTVTSSLNNEDKEIVSHETSYMCVPMDAAFNSNINDTCVGGPCPTTTESYRTQPGVYIDKSKIKTTKAVYNFLYTDDQNETEGYPLQWDTIPNDNIIDVIGDNGTREMNNISPEVFLDFYSFDSIAQKGYVNKTVTDSGIKILSFPTPTPGGTIFIAENNGLEGLEVTAVVGQAYSVQLPPEDAFAPGSRGSILYGEGTILYGSFGGINLSKFNGAIRTATGRIIFSRPTLRYKHTGKYAVTIGNTEHLKSLRKFDPTFLPLANNLRLNLEPRSAVFQLKGYGFRSWDDPGSGRPIVSEPFDREDYAFSSRNLIEPQFSFPVPDINEFREIRGEFIPYTNEVTSSRNVFSKNIHRGIAAVLQIVKNNKNNYAPQFFYDISLDNIQKSLRPDINELIIIVYECFIRIFLIKYFFMGVYI